MLRKTCGLALALALLGGCDKGEDATDDVNTPSEGARIENENPTTPTVDVPDTPENEATEAGAPTETTPSVDMPAETPGIETPTPTPAPGTENTPEANADNNPDKEPTIVTAPADTSGDNAGKKTLEDADAAATSGDDKTP